MVRFKLFLMSFLLSTFVVSASDKKVETIDFEKQVLPILENSCVKCHKEAYMKKGKLKKPKAGLRLDYAAGIIKGSEDGKVLEPGKPAKSSLYTTTILPEDHDDIMPAKGDVLTKKQTETLRLWILQGAKFNGWVGNAPKKAPANEEDGSKKKRAK